jgi:hypothetical protein
MASVPLLKPHSHCSALPSSRRSGLHGGCPVTVHAQRPAGRSGATALKARAFPLDVVPLMVTMVEHVDNQRDWVVTKSIWHLSDTAIKSFCETLLQNLQILSCAFARLHFRFL